MKSLIFILIACVHFSIPASEAVARSLPFSARCCAGAGSVGTAILAANCAQDLAQDLYFYMNCSQEEIDELHGVATNLGERTFKCALYAYVAYELGKAAFGL